MQQPGQNESWSRNFTGDRMMDARKIRTLNIIDDCNREVLDIEIDTSISSTRVIRFLDKVTGQKR